MRSPPGEHELTIITLITDFGLKDGNVGAMKGVILRIAPDAQIVDISHLVSAQDIVEGALILGRVVPFFPGGTVHIGVVDPGVGTQRRPIAGRLGDQFFVGPDNGLCSMLLKRAEKRGEPLEIFHLDQSSYWLPEVSNVFHGRDIFAPIAAHLAKGVPLHALGTRIHDPVCLNMPEPERIETGWRGQVIHIDHFGNIASNILRTHMAGMESITVRLCGQEIFGLVKTFGDRSPGELIALFGSSGNLIVSLVNGDAAARIHANLGDPVEVVAKP
jgi:S-adenosylmethionine hydrolase